MALPSGYKRLEYIQSTGSQYVDTGFTPNSNTRIVADFQIVLNNTTYIAVFGQRSSSGGQGNFLFLQSGLFQAMYGSSYSGLTSSTSVATNRHVCDFDKNVVTIAGAKKTLTVSSFTGAATLVLFACNTSGNKELVGTTRFYSCQIYDNGTLVRDFIPCQTTFGEIGLWDDVNSVFYGNVGTGTFTAGPVVAIAADLSEVTELEYIKSSGTQYVDTELRPNNNTRVVMDAEMESGTSNYCLFGARTSYDLNNYSLSWIGSYFRSDYNSVYSQQWSVTQTTRRIYDKNKETTTIDEDAKSYKNASFQSTCNLLLLANNNNGSVQWKATAKVYSCQIYDNDTLVRDYIAAKLSDGTVGLYDKINGLLYINVGTGTFAAGPVAVVVPDPPSNLHQTMAVRLAWAAVSGAERYNVYRDGTLLATTTDLAYVDDTVAENQEYTYGVSAVNSAGESPKTTISVYTKTGYFLYKPVVESANFQ